MKNTKASIINGDIFVVEDSPTQREQIRHLLESHGFSVRTASNGREALDHMRKHQPALVISDIVMPEMDGYALCEKMKSDSDLKDIPVILLTSLSGPEDIIKGLQCGADNFIKKPFDERYLLSRVEYILVNRKLRKSDKLQLGVELYLGGRKHFITAERQQILDLLISTYEQAVHLNQELASRQKEIDRANKILQGLYQISKNLNQAATEQQLLDNVLKRAMELHDFQSGWITLVEGESGFRVVATHGFSLDLKSVGALEGECSCRRKLLFGELQSSTIIPQCERLAEINGGTPGWHSHVSVPLVTSNRALGIMNLVISDEILFNDNDVHTLNGIGHQIGIALERVRMKEHLEQLVQERTAALTAEIAERKRAEDALRETELKFRSVWEKATDGMRITNEKGVVLLVNDAYCKMVDKPHEEIEGKPMSIVYEVAAQAKTLRRLQERFRSRSVPASFERDIVLWNGKRISFELSNTFLEIPSQPTLLLSILRDTTERKQAEDALRESESRYRTLVNISPDAITLTDLNENIILVNQRTVELHGYDTVEEMVGLNAFSLIAPEDRELATANARRTFEVGSVRDVQYTLLKKDGTTFPAELGASTIVDARGKPQAFIAITRNITERKRAEEALVKLSQAIDASGEAIFLTDREGIFTFVNPGFTSLYGYAAAEVVGKTTPRILKSGLLGSDTYDAFWKTLVNGQETRGELKNRRKDGTLVEVDGSASAILGEKKNIIGFLGIQRDITERKRAEEALRKSEEQYRQFFEDDLTGDYVSTPDGKILSCNPAFARIFGFESVKEVLNTDAGTVFNEPENQGKFLRLLREKKRLEYYESEFLLRDGSRVYCIENAVGIFDPQGELAQIRGYIFDESRRKLLERQLVQAQKLESLGTLASGIAHDFNNILGIILGYATLLTRGEPNPDNIRNSAQAVVKASMRGAALVKQLLTFARKADAQLVSVRLNDIVSEISELLSETMTKVIGITLDLEKRLPAISADPTQIHQVILNLCVNARDAMPNGGTLTLATHLQWGDAIRNKFPTAAARQYVALSVADTGVGMDERTRSRIFEPFFTTKEIGKGTGLGLSVVFGIMESHKGFVNVESEAGKGTTFNLYFPIPQSVEIKQANAELEKEIPGGTETLLVVEDEELLRELLRTSLRSAGYTVLTAVDGQEAIDLFDQHWRDIQLVLSDIGLPKLSGYNVFRKMKRTKPNLRFILASGSIEPQLKSEISKEGLEDFVQKPYSVYEVLQAVRSILDRK